MAAGLPSQLILEIEQGFNDLRKEYILFLNGVSNIEPYEIRDKLSQKVKRLRNLNHHRTEDQFRANNIIAKVQSHFQLWDRQVEKKLSGDAAAIRRRKKKLEDQEQEGSEVEKKKAQQPKAARSRSGVVISDPSKQPKQMEALYDEYMKLNLSMGKKKVINFTKFQSFIQNQTNKVKSARNVDKVRYEVSVQDDKVVIKSRKVKE